MINDVKIKLILKYFENIC